MRLQRWAGMVVVSAVLATGCGDGDGGDNEAGSGPPDATTTTPTTTTSPSTDPTPPLAPVFDGISPARQADLLRLQAEVDAGHQPWRLDPVATARAYLVDIGVPGPTMGELREAGRRTVEVRFDDAGGVGGHVVLRRLGEGSLPYVVRVETARVDNLGVERRVGEVRVEAYSRAPGTLQARVGAFDTEWQAEESVPVEVGPVTVVLAVGEDESPMALQLRHEGADGKVGISVLRLQPVAPPAGTGPAVTACRPPRRSPTPGSDRSWSG